MTIKSAAFEAGQTIPMKYTCDGENMNPPLIFGDVPSAARSLSIIMDDPDAPNGAFVHWLVWNITPETTDVSETADGLNGTKGINDFGAIGYGGPCPPSGDHRYLFRLYALDRMLDLAAGAQRQQLEAAMKGHIIAQTELMGTYQKTAFRAIF